MSTRPSVIRQDKLEWLREKQILIGETTTLRRLLDGMTQKIRDLEGELSNVKKVSAQREQELNRENMGLRQRIQESIAEMDMKFHRGANPNFRYNPNMR
jgi:hypothetical protein